MNVELTRHEVRALLESLNYSRERVDAKQATPKEVKAGKLKELEAVAEKLRQALNNEK